MHKEKRYKFAFQNHECPVQVAMQQQFTGTGLFERILNCFLNFLTQIASKNNSAHNKKHTRNNE